MLSFKKGKPIAYIKGGKFDGQYIRLYEEDKKYKCCDICSDKCKKKKCCKDCNFKSGGCNDCKKIKDLIIDNTNTFTLLDSRYFNKFPKLSIMEKNKLERAYKNGGNIEFADDILNKVYNSLSNDLDTLKKYQFDINDGELLPCPNPEKNDDGSYIADCCYASAPQGAGKSTILSKYIEMEKKLHPKKDVIIFSSFEKDKPLDEFNPIRIKIDDKMVDNPIKKEECRNSICVFDDIDTIQPKKLANACQALRNDFLQCGRKENIKVLATSHQIMNYKLTRDLINSCNKFMLFPRATSAYHLTRFFSMYLGLDKHSIKYILKIPSRWIMIEKSYPSYLIHEHGCILLNKIPEILDINKISDSSKKVKKYNVASNNYGKDEDLNESPEYEEETEEESDESEEFSESSESEEEIKKKPKKQKKKRKN